MTEKKIVPDDVPWLCVDSQGRFCVAPTSEELANAIPEKRKLYEEKSIWDWEWT